MSTLVIQGNRNAFLYDAYGNPISSLNGSINANITNASLPVVVVSEEANTASGAVQYTISTATTILTSNSSRFKLILQNVGTTQIYVTLGTGTLTTSAYHFALPAGGSINDGSSPVYVDQMWQGAVKVLSSAAGGLVVISEYST